MPVTKRKGEGFRQKGAAHAEAVIVSKLQYRRALGAAI